MCGIFGFFGVHDKKTPEYIKQLGIKNEERGTDSTGLSLFSNDNVFFDKRCSKASDFFKRKRVRKMLNYHMRQNDFSIVMGHTRLATHGAVTARNAHPFRYGKTVFTHNGIINNHLSLSHKHGVNFQVDSQIIGYLLQKSGKVGLDSLNGMFTVPYVNIGDMNRLQVAVHDQVFSFALSNDGKSLFYSSLEKHLEAVLPKKDYTVINADDESLLYTFDNIRGYVVMGIDRIYPKSYTYYNGYYTGHNFSQYDTFYDPNEDYDQYPTGTQQHLPDVVEGKKIG